MGSKGACGVQGDYIKTTVAVPRQKQRRSIPKAFRFFILCCMSAIIALCIGIFILIRSSNWGGTHALSFLVVFRGENKEHIQRPLTIVTLKPSEETITTLEIPDTLRIEALHGYGQYPASALYGLMQLEKLPASFLTQAISFQFGIPVSHILVVDEERQQLGVDTLSRLSFENVTMKQSSTLPYLDRLKVWWFISHVRKNKVNQVDLQSSGAIQGDVLDIVKNDSIISSIFPDQQLRQEQLSVAVVNTTSEAKLASRVGRALFNMGINVVRVTDTKLLSEKTYMAYSYDTQKQSETIRVISRMFDVAKNGVVQDVAATNEYRADIVLFIGDDTASVFSTTR